MNILILSGTTKPQYSTRKNHAEYAARHDYDYVFDTGPYTDLPSPYFLKVASLLKHLPKYDWVFWIDDDAVFTRPDISLENLVPEMAQEPETIFCKSPINRGAWTYVSSGNFLARRTQKTIEALSATLATSLEDVRAWWDDSKFGMFTNGDQDAIVYHIIQGTFGEVLRLEYERFNTRPFHFDRLAAENFLVHFTYVPGKTKQQQMDEFCLKFDFDADFMPITPVMKIWRYIQKTTRLRTHRAYQG